MTATPAKFVLFLLSRYFVFLLSYPHRESEGIYLIFKYLRKMLKVTARKYFFNLCFIAIADRGFPV